MGGCACRGKERVEQPCFVEDEFETAANATTCSDMSYMSEEEWYSTPHGIWQ